MAVFIKAGNVELPAPTKISVSNEIIWSSNTGRSTESGKMIGDVIAEKKTVDVEWSKLTAADLKKISSNLKSGFIPVSFNDEGSVVTITAYRGTLKKDYLGYFGGVHYYDNVTVSIIQQ